MTTVQILAGNLTASVEDRVTSGLLLPFGELGNTNLGKFSVDGPGIFSIPSDVSVLNANEDHKQTEPRARFLTATETPAGIVASFKVGSNPEGDALLARIEEGRKNGKPVSLSVEVKDVILRAGKAISGALTGAAFVDRGAFPSAALMAADVGEATETSAHSEDEYTDENGVTWRRVSDTNSATEGNKTTTVTTVTEELETKEEDDVTVATVPSTLAAAAPAAKTEKRPLSVYEVGVLYAQRSQGIISDLEFATALENENGATLFAALSDVKFDGTGGLAPTLSPTPQWLGQVWQATTYRQQVLPLFTHGNLTALTFAGFKWTTKPSGGDWAGNKGNVPSNTLVVAPVNGIASRYAIGHDIAREFVDFPVEGFFESYAAAVSEDYAKWADAKVAAAAIAGATTLTADALTTLPGVAGGTIGSAASAIIDGAAAIITTGSLPDFALVATALWKQMAKMPRTNVIGYLNVALGLEEGALDGFTIRPSASVAAGKVLVGAKEAATVYELPGSPIRVDALDLARGGVDKAAFGYLGVNINDASGLQLVTAATS